MTTHASHAPPIPVWFRLTPFVLDSKYIHRPYFELLRLVVAVDTHTRTDTVTTAIGRQATISWVVGAAEWRRTVTSFESPARNIPQSHAETRAVGSYIASWLIRVVNAC